MYKGRRRIGRATASVLGAAQDNVARYRFKQTGARIDASASVPAGSRVTAKTSVERGTGFMGPVFIEGFTEVVFRPWGAIGHNLRVVSSQHDVKRANMHMPLQSRLGLPQYLTTKGPVSIGPAVWIGDSVTILGGVSIGSGAVIGTGSLVTQDVPPFAIAFGVPAEVHRLRFSSEVIEALLQVSWWDWALDRIERNREFFALDLTVAGVSEILNSVRD